jgi:hypothetical protein
LRDDFSLSDEEIPDEQDFDGEEEEVEEQDEEERDRAFFGDEDYTIMSKAPEEEEKMMSMTIQQR